MSAQYNTSPYVQSYSTALLKNVFKGESKLFHYPCLFRSCDDHQSPGSGAVHRDGGAGGGGDQPHRDAERQPRDPCPPEICRGWRPRVEGAGLSRAGDQTLLLWSFFYDYLQIGTPPPTFFLFFQQYDWNIYTGETLSHKVELSNYNIYPVHAFNPFQDIEERKNLLIQFRKWKKRKRKTFNIVVTERSRREMAEQEEEKNKKRIPPSK